MSEQETNPAEQQSNPAPTEQPSGGEPRRGFLTKLRRPEFLAAAIGGLVGFVPFVMGSLFFLDPLIRKRDSDAADTKKRPGGVEKDDEGFIKMTITANDLPEDGTPQSFQVKDDIIDAWNKFLDQRIGSVWLRKGPGGKVLCFSTICPHLGCAVEYRNSEKDFYCPCHASAFDLDGNKTNVIPPRSMDSLKYKIKNGNEIWIKYEKFRAAEEEQILI